eukprot:3444574-Amphidinium_carterae.1
MTKVHGPENPADLITKFLDAESMYKHLKKLGLEVWKDSKREAPSSAGGTRASLEDEPNSRKRGARKRTPHLVVLQPREGG